MDSASREGGLCREVNFLYSIHVHMEHTWTVFLEKVVFVVREFLLLHSSAHGQCF